MILVLPAVSHGPGDKLPGQLPGAGVEVSRQDHQVTVRGEAPVEKVCQLQSLACPVQQKLKKA